MRLVAALVALALLAAGPGAAGAAAVSCPRASLPDIEDEVMCLQCGVPLNVAEDAPSATRERAFIRSMIARCETKQQIKDQLVAQFGSRILAQPSSSTAWLVPVIAFVAGALAVGYGAWEWRRRRVRASAAPAATLSSSDSARLEADLDRYDL